MKQIIALFLAAAVVNFAAAHGSHGSHGGSGDDEGSGISAGMELGAHLHGGDGEEGMEVVPNLAWMLNYEESFLDDKLDFSFGLSYFLYFKKGAHLEFEDHLPGAVKHGDHTHGGDFDKKPQYIGLNLGVAYNLGLDENVTLSFLLQNYNEFFVCPVMSGQNNVVGKLTPGVKLNRSVDIGDVFVQYGVPLQYLFYYRNYTKEYYDENSNLVKAKVREKRFGVDNDFTFGWNGKFGLGAEFVTHFNLWRAKGFDGFDCVVSYAIPIKKVSVYFYCAFEDIGMGEVHFAPAVGITYSF